jgi:hypothetical protein
VQLQPLPMDRLQPTTSCRRWYKSSPRKGKEPTGMPLALSLPHNHSKSRTDGFLQMTRAKAFCSGANCTPTMTIMRWATRFSKESLGL